MGRCRSRGNLCDCINHGTGFTTKRGFLIEFEAYMLGTSPVVPLEHTLQSSRTAAPPMTPAQSREQSVPADVKGVWIRQDTLLHRNAAEGWEGETEHKTRIIIY